MRKPTWFAVVCGALVGLASAETTIARLDVYPPSVNLATKRDRQPFLVVATRSDDVTLDVTAQATASLVDGAVARLDGRTIYPSADGQTALQVAFEGHAVEIPVTVERAAEELPVSFRLDVMPVFMRAGCNTGSCHGAARGKDGFNLSLFGFDPAGDHYRLTHEIGFRRVNLAVPEESLLIEKALGEVPHSGGKRFDRDSEYCQTLLEWLRNGAPNDPSEPPRVERVEIFPPEAVLEGEGATQQFIARAVYADGTDRDVTHLAVFLTSNDNSAKMGADGLVTAAARGEAFVMARFATHTVGSQVLALPAGLHYEPPPSQPANYVDELVDAKLQKLRVLPSDICSDETFLRRATIDITGSMPTVDEYSAFLADASPDKRSKHIDRLLERKEFSELWAMKWAELLMIRSTITVSPKSALLYNNWLTDKIANEVPLDEMVKELLTASGGTFKNPATNFYQIEPATLKMSENVAQVFMGIRTQCAQCHNHPFDRWTMDDYYSFAAFFAQVGRKTGEDYREQIVFNAGGGEVTHLVGGRVMPPKFLGGPTPDLTGRDRREVLAEWLVSADNPFFATSVANRVWAHFFGVGIVEPVDDVRVSNPPSNPELFEALGKKLSEYRYDFKRLVRDICNSKTYQRTTERNESNELDERNFAHSRVRRIQAEMLLDCVSQVTGTKDDFARLPVGARAAQIADGAISTYFLDTFGRAPRTTVCAADVKNDPTLSQALHLINGDTIEQKIHSGGLIPSLLAAGHPPEHVIDTLYVRALSRKPSTAEREQLLGAVAAAPAAEQGLEDVFWAILNSREFCFNH